MPHKANQTSFKKGNKCSEKYPFETAKAKIIAVYDYMKNTEDCVTFVDAIIDCNEFNYPSDYYHLLRRFPELKKYKKDTQDKLKARLSNLALHNKINASVAIFRLKVNGDNPATKVSQTVEINDPAEMTTAELLKRAGAIQKIQSKK